MAHLINDLLDQACAEPQSALSWHRLFHGLAASPDRGAWQGPLHQLAAMTFGEPRAEIFRLSFLRDVTGDWRYAEQAAAQVLALEPANPDRLAAYMAYPWLCALASEADRSRFVAALVGARLPAMAARLAQCARALLAPSLKPRLAQSIRRVAVIAPSLGDRSFPPGVMVANQCEVLARQGCQLHVFSCEELQPPDVSLFRGSPAQVLLAAPDTAYWLTALPRGSHLSISDTRFSLMQRWRDILPAVAQFDPDAVLLVGLYSPLAAALHGVRPVVGMNSHSLPPLAPLDVWLSADDAAAAGPGPWHDAFPLGQSHYHPYRIKRLQGPWSLTRAELGLPETAVIWLTVGARLESEVSGAWAAAMMAQLIRHPDAIWLLVGGAGNLPPALAHGPRQQIRVLPARSDIGGVLHRADIYLNPPRMGGGFSVAEAMAEGLPVLSFANSDGGDKVGALALTAMDDYLTQLSALTRSANLRAEMGQTLRARFDQRFDLAASGPSLMAAFDQALVRAKTRLASGAF